MKFGTAGGRGAATDCAMLALLPLLQVLSAGPCPLTKYTQGIHATCDGQIIEL